LLGIDAAYAGSGLLKPNNGSVVEAVVSNYPTHKWQPWKFSQSPKQYWSKLGRRFSDPATSSEAEGVVRNYLESIGPQFGVWQPSAWLLVPSEKLVAIDKRLEPLGGLYSVLRRLYPDQTLHLANQANLHAHVETLMSGNS